MDILFIHGNYPGQFRHLASVIGSNKDHRVVFLTKKKVQDCENIDGVNVRSFNTHRSASSQTHHYLQATEECILNGQAVCRELENLKNEGFIPNIVISHGGVGLGIFIKDMLPKSIHVGYFEWFFSKKTAYYLTNEKGIDAEAKISIRNHAIWHELNSCDVGVVPTQWQKQQFPKEYHYKLNVIFDGIDTSFFKPSEAEESSHEKIVITNRDTLEKFSIMPNEKILTYATRGMETLRGFKEFMKAANDVLKIQSNLKVVIAGADRRAYSYDAPTTDGSWKTYCMERVSEINKDKFIFVGLLNYQDYRRLLWRTNLHCYFTRPYVTSWSLFEAASCGASMLINKCESTDNIVEKTSASWVDIDDHESIVRSMHKQLKKEERKKARILSGYELTTSLEKWEQLINQELSKYNK